MTVRFSGLAVDWFGYATLRVAPDGSARDGAPGDGDAPEGERAGAGGPVVYTDPGRYGVLDDYDARDGDLVLVTHDHHYDSDGVRRVAAPDATVVVFDAVDTAGIDRDVDPVADLEYDVVRVGEGDSLRPAGVSVEVLPAYNDPDGPHTTDAGDPNHPRGFGCGYRFAVGDTTVFWTGDSDAIPEHEGLDVDLFVPPIGGSFTMDRRAAADLAARLDPGLVVPVHYDTFDALEADPRAFAADVAESSVPVALDPADQ